MGSERSVRLVACALFTAGFASCRSAPSLRVGEQVLDKITIENKLLLFDAENELNIAIDDRDRVVDEIEELKETMRRTKEKLVVAERDEDVFSDKGDAERVKVAKLRADASRARLEFLEAKLEWARERLTRERAKLIVARAQFELAKAQLVKKNNVPGASEIDLADFEEQVKDYAEDVSDADADIQEAATEMKAMETAWSTRAEALRAATGGALGSRWLD